MQELKYFSLPKNFRGKKRWYIQIWWIVQKIFFELSPQFMYGWRRFLLRLFGAKIGKGVILRPTAKIQFPWKVSIGDYSWIGDEVVLYSLGDIVIGNNVVISQKSYLCTGSHNYKSKNFDIYSKKIIIEDKVWIATDVFIAPGITIGEFSIIGARSSVFNDIPSGYICYGNPAKIIKKRI